MFEGKKITAYLEKQFALTAYKEKDTRLEVKIEKDARIGGRIRLKWEKKRR